MAQLKITNEELQKALLNQKPVSYFSNEIREMVSKMDIYKIQTFNNSMVQHFQSINISQLLAKLNQESNVLRKALDSIDFYQLKNAIEEQSKITKLFYLNFDSKKYRELIQITLVKYEIEYNQYKVEKASEYEKVYVAMKEYKINEDQKIIMPIDFEEFYEFYEFWTDSLPYHANENKISRKDFIKFHFFCKEKLDKETQLITLQLEQPLPVIPLLENNVSVPEKKEKPRIEQKPNSKQRRVLRLIVEEMKKGTQKTDVINDSFKKAGYKNVRQVWTIVRKVESGELLFKELNEIFQ